MDPTNIIGENRLRQKRAERTLTEAVEYVNDRLRSHYRDDAKHVLADPDCHKAVSKMAETLIAVEHTRQTMRDDALSLITMSAACLSALAATITLEQLATKAIAAAKGQ